MIVSDETPVKSPRRMPARSLRRNQCLRSRPSSALMPGKDQRLSSCTLGDWVTPPPGILANVNDAR
jgi:hypothetical protein